MDESTETKTCSTCGVEKPLTDFPRYGKCRACIAAYQRMRRRTNPEQYKGYELTRSAESREVRRKAGRAYYRANRDKISAYSASRYQANRERFIQLAGEWRRANPEKMAVYYRRYREKNPDIVRVRNQNRRTLLGGRKVSLSELESIWTGSCALCDDPIDRSLKFPDPLSRSVDHAMPLAKGGLHVIANLQWAHLGCNMAKSDSL